MKKNRQFPAFGIFSAYFAASLLATFVILLFCLGAARFGGALARLALGLERFSAIGPVSGDAAVYALVCALTAPTQYYLVSLLSVCGFGRMALFAAVGWASLFSGLFFWRAAVLSSLGSYGFSGLPVVLAALIGGAAAIGQRPGENPWPADFQKLLSRFF